MKSSFESFVLLKTPSLIIGTGFIFRFALTRQCFQCWFSVTVT